MFQPLKSVRVIGLSQSLAGPYITDQLARADAEVVKIEKSPAKAIEPASAVHVRAPDGACFPRVLADLPSRLTEERSA